MIEAAPVFELKTDPEYESNVTSFSYNDDGLIVIVESAQDEIYKLTFGEQIWSFRYMEEGDLTYYWQSRKFSENFMLYEITKGGWLSKERSPLDIMGIARTDWFREWFIATRNFSVTVLSNSQPTIERVPNA